MKKVGCNTNLGVLRLLSAIGIAIGIVNILSIFYWFPLCFFTGERLDKLIQLTYAYCEIISSNILLIEIFLVLCIYLAYKRFTKGNTLVITIALLFLSIISSLFISMLMSLNSKGNNHFNFSYQDLEIIIDQAMECTCYTNFNFMNPLLISINAPR